MRQRTPFEIAKDWYRESDIEYSIKRTRSIAAEQHEKIPEDVYSLQFAVWLTDQYRLAMAKGIQLERDAPEVQELRAEVAAWRERFGQAASFDGTCIVLSG